MNPTKNAVYLVVAALAGFAVAAPLSAAEPLRTAHGRVVKSNLPTLPANFRDRLNPEPVVPLAERQLVEPVVDAPMRSPSVCRGPDGIYYLTGQTPVQRTDGALDWNKGTEVRLWKSADLMAEYDLPACPVFDGMSAAAGKVLISLVNGQIVCLKTK